MKAFPTSRLISDVKLALLYPDLLVLRLWHRLAMRQLVELRQMRDEGLFRGITHYIDAGACEGVYAEAVMRSITGVRLICFEPAPAAYGKLADRFKGNRAVRCVRSALGTDSGETVLNISGIQQASSLLPMNGLHTSTWKESGYVGRVTVEVRRLESYLQELKTDENAFLKIDVQGFEKQVLEGCGAGLRKVQLLQLELSLVGLYEGAPLLPEMIAFLSDVGFDLYDVVGRVLDPATGGTLQLDGLFVRRQAHD